MACHALNKFNNKMNKKFEIILTSTVGNIAEQYDFALYGFFAAIIAKLFFPIANQFNSLLLTFGVFAIGFFTRPIGALIFGHIGDRYGRKIALVISIPIITLSTTIIGLLPTYQSIGVAAPIALIICRLIQGLALSGELAGSGIFLFETAAITHQGFWTSFALISTYIGFLIGAIMGTLTNMFLPAQAIMSYGWRLPFLLSFIFGIFATITRIKCAESIVFTKVLAEKKYALLPIVEAFKKYWREIILIFFANGVGGVTFYLMIGYFPSFFMTHLKFTLTQTLVVNISLLFLIILTFILGKISDKFSPKKLVAIGIIGNILFAYPIFWLASLGTLFSAIAAESILVFFLAFLAAGTLVFSNSILPIKIRYTVTAISYNSAMAVFGGTAPLVSALCVKYFHTSIAPFGYVMLVGIISLIALMKLRKTFQSEL